MPRLRVMVMEFWVVVVVVAMMAVVTMGILSLLLLLMASALLSFSVLTMVLTKVLMKKTPSLPSPSRKAIPLLLYSSTHPLKQTKTNLPEPRTRQKPRSETKTQVSPMANQACTRHLLLHPLSHLNSNPARHVPVAEDSSASAATQCHAVAEAGHTAAARRPGS